MVAQRRLLSDVNMKHSHCVFALPYQIDAACAFYRQYDFVVLFNQAAENHDRTISRTSLRASVKQFLAQAGAVDKDKIHLHAEAGQAPYAQIQKERISLSFSHDRNYAAAAIHRYQNIGIDLLATDIDFNWRDVARLYLSSTDYQLIESLPDIRQAHQFAVCWAMYEAKLKYCGIPLQEWCAELEQGFSRCKARIFDETLDCALPPNVLIALALDVEYDAKFWNQLDLDSNCK